MNKRFQRGGIATILAVGALVVLGITAVVTSVVVQKNKQTTKTKAADVSGGFCEDPNYLLPAGIDLDCDDGYSKGEYISDLDKYCCVKNQTGNSTASQPSTCTGQSTGKTGECITKSPSECAGFYNYIKDGACGFNKICCVPASQPAQPSFTCAPPEELRFENCGTDEIPTNREFDESGYPTGNICCKPSQSTNTNQPSDLYWYFDKSWNGCVKVTDRFDDKAHCERDLASWARSNTTVASNITLTPTCYTSLDSCKAANPPPAAPPAVPAPSTLSCPVGDEKIAKGLFDIIGCPSGFSYRNDDSKEVCCKPDPVPAKVPPPANVLPPPVAPGSPGIQPGTVPGQVCAQVITYAVSPQGVCQQFPNSCIPAGWTVVPNCPAQPVNLPVPAPQAPASCPPNMPSKSIGNADCNTSIDDTDYSIWLNEYLKKTSLNADFNSDGKVDLVDFEIWRRNKVDLQTAPIGGGRDD